MYLCMHVRMYVNVCMTIMYAYVYDMYLCMHVNASIIVRCTFEKLTACHARAGGSSLVTKEANRTDVAAAVATTTTTTTMFNNNKQLHRSKELVFEYSLT